jgi:hypothetical protein
MTAYRKFRKWNSGTGNDYFLFCCKRHIETKGHKKKIDKFGANNKSFPEFCVNSVKTCNSAETRRGNQTNTEMMLCTFIAQINPYKQTIIFNKVYDIHDVYCRKRDLIFQDFFSWEGGILKPPLQNWLKLLWINEENYYRSTGLMLLLKKYTCFHLSPATFSIHLLVLKFFYFINLYMFWEFVNFNIIKIIFFFF